MLASRLWVLTLVTLATVPAIVIACGDDETKNSSPVGESDGGADGGVPGVDATTGNGDGGPTGGRDGACVPRAQAPSVLVASSCGTIASCGGNLEGTTWHYTDVCAPRAELFKAVTSVCSSSNVVWGVSGTPTGTISFQSGVLERKLNVKASGSVSFPNECGFCQCTNLESQLKSAGLSTASCAPTCNGGRCDCFVSYDATYDFSSPYAVAGGVITAGAKTFSFCANDGGLDMVETTDGGSGMPGTAKLAPGALNGPMPEICDGKDNDGNGKIDDDPVDCPPCKTEGVCATASTATCKGEQGWSCAYTSPKYEEDEKTCDLLDNDCDGTVDEMGGCAEVCDGKDNDGNGVVDDNLTGAPTCPTGQGVCSSGAVATCKGAAGWSCGYASAQYEAYETKCDGVDNDCNGSVDEGCTCVTGASKVVYTTGTKLIRANLDGTSPQTILDVTGNDAGVGIGPVSVDRLRGVVYFWNGSAIEKISLLGAGRTTLYTSPSLITPQSLALDMAHGHLYFRGKCPSDGMCRIDATTPGSATKIAIGGTFTSAGIPWAGIAVDTFASKLYWFGYLGPDSPPELTVYNSNLDGSGTAIAWLDHAGYGSLALAIDPGHRAVYWAENSSPTGLFKKGLDGTPDKMLLVENSPPHWLAVDPKDGFVYRATDAALKRVNVDGTNDINVVNGLMYGVDVYVCP